MAEQLAENHMRSIGFRDAELTAAGADGGIDVTSTMGHVPRSGVEVEPFHSEIGPLIQRNISHLRNLYVAVTFRGL